MYKSLIYNRNVATSITSQGRSFIATAGMFFEQFLADNVKFSCLDEVLMFIKHTCDEAPKRKYDDHLILSRFISPDECFAKLVMDCGYNYYIPDNDDLEIIWQTVLNLNQEDLNRVYYKNNLYDFLDNTYMQNFIRSMVASLDDAFLSPSEIPAELKEPLQEFTSLLEEYVMNHYQIMDRIVRWQSMIKTVCVASDTDSAFVNLDAWVRYATNVISDIDLKICHKAYKINPFEEIKPNDEGKYKVDPFVYIEPQYDYDFYNDKLVEMRRTINPIYTIPQDNVRYTLINIMSYVVTELCNKYIEDDVRKINASEGEGIKCRMYLKNEFLNKRMLLTYVKKNYAAYQELQEGNIIPPGINTALDAKGLPGLVKSVTPASTKKALKEILYNDIFTVDKIDQIKIIKDLAILEKKIINSLYKGSKEFYKPATVKSIAAYKNPMSIQGIRAIVCWNALKSNDELSLDTNERNAVVIAKIKLDKRSLDSVKEKDERLYEKAKALLDDPIWEGSIDSIAIPLEQDVPQWLMEILDFDKIINDNLSGFPLSSVNIMPANDNINYVNTLKL